VRKTETERAKRAAFGDKKEAPRKKKAVLF
jgi:hypothetical protein